MRLVILIGLLYISYAIRPEYIDSLSSADTVLINFMVAYAIILDTNLFNSKKK
jgi:hypothetical protein